MGLVGKRIVVKENEVGVTQDGWLDWAIRMPGRPATGNGFNPGVNPVRGLVFHSAEGWAATLLSPTSQWGYYSAQFPWHVSNLLDGRLVQHYPFTVRCWHGSAFNDSYVGMEHEGVTPQGTFPGPVLNNAQVANASRVISDLAAWKGWEARRPGSADDKTATLYEHGETVRFGGTSTSCPSGRIPWEKLLAPPPAQWVPTTEDYFRTLSRVGYFIDQNYNLADLDDYAKQALRMMADSANS